MYKIFFMSRYGARPGYQLLCVSRYLRTSLCLLRLPLFSPNLSVCRMIDGQQRAWRELATKWCFWCGWDYNKLVHNERMWLLKMHRFAEDRGWLRLFLLERHGSENGKLSVNCFHCSSVKCCMLLLLFF